MPSSKSLPESAEILRLALPLMSKFKIPVTPRNYAVWYEYASGSNTPLTQKLDSQIKSGGPISSDLVAALYGEFIDAKHELNQLESAQNIFSVLYQTLTAVLQDASGSASEYGRLLEQYRERMQGAGDFEQLQPLIQDLAFSTEAMLNNNSELLANLDQKRSEVAALQEQLITAKEQARTDPLTQLCNRRTFFEGIDELYSHPNFKGGVHCLLMLDIDDFKNINDSYGHLFGDKVIRTVARVLQENTKGKDLSARYGGEEFIAFLPDTARDGALVVAELVRKTIADARIVNPRNDKVASGVTVSIGMTEVRDQEPIESTITRADDALYKAKGSGKNRVVVG